MITKRLDLILIVFFMLLTQYCFSAPENWFYYGGKICLINGDTLNGGILFYEASTEDLIIDNGYCGWVSTVESLDSIKKIDEWFKDSKDDRLCDDGIDYKISIRRIYFKDIKTLSVVIDKKNDLNIIDSFNFYIGSKISNRTAYFTKSVEYINLDGSNNLWRVLKKNDSVAICSDLIAPINDHRNAARNMLLVIEKEKIRMFSFWGWFFRNSNTEKLLIHFINKRYHKSFKKSDFKKIEDIFDYILINK